MLRFHHPLFQFLETILHYLIHQIALNQDYYNRFFYIIKPTLPEIIILQDEEICNIKQEKIRNDLVELEK